MAVLVWPASLPIAARASPGVIHVQLEPENIGPFEDIVHRWSKRTMTLEWENLEHADFLRLDALVELLGGSRQTIKVPWMSYEEMIGGGTGNIQLTADHSAGDITISTTGWGGSNPVVDFGDYIQISQTVPRLHRIMSFANRSGADATITIEPGLWQNYTPAVNIYHLRDLDTTNPLPHLVSTMRLTNPNDVQGQVFPSNPGAPYGRGIVYSFVEAIRANY